MEVMRSLLIASRWIPSRGALASCGCCHYMLAASWRQEASCGAMAGTRSRESSRQSSPGRWAMRRNRWGRHAFVSARNVRPLPLEKRGRCRSPLRGSASGLRPWQRIAQTPPPSLSPSERYARDRLPLWRDEPAGASLLPRRRFRKCAGEYILHMRKRYS